MALGGFPLRFPLGGWAKKRIDVSGWDYSPSTKPLILGHCLEVVPQPDFEVTKANHGS